MTQVVVCSTHEGVILATDSRATWFDQSGERRHFNLKKLIPLGSHSAMVSTGAGIGVEMGLAFQQFLRHEKVEGIEDIFRLALPFFVDQFGIDASRNGAQRFPVQEEDFPITGVYLVLAGYSFKDRCQPYQLCLLGSERVEISISVRPTGPIVVLPRSLSMEKRLEAQREGGASLRQLLALCRSFLRKRADEGEEVGPPFHMARITSSGFKEIGEGEETG